MHISALLQHAQQCLSASETPRLDAEVLLAHVLQQSRTYLHTWPEREVSEPVLQQFMALLQQRQSGIPVAHLLGEREFWSLPLKVNDSTLIPRPDTELLVEKILELNLPSQARVLDLGTGTGAIALALKSERPQWQVTAVDKSAAAVALAKANAARLQLALQIFQSDWFSSLADEHYDLIVSNPPYIAADDPHLQQGDVRFEPHSALVADAAGFADLASIIHQAPDYLQPGGWLWLEHGYEQAQGCRDLLASRGFSAVQSLRDYANLERISYGRWRNKEAN
ncbi:peptide chain release factor N(5)-glutamine methyltransferase [Pseudidiomarina insulisalsae]|nr:peptide chain release factor N(5)-glutamine methyltransferase [Pseudidiomarina insulisalsae]